MALTKADIVEAIRKENGFSKSKSVDVVETVLELIKGTLASGEDVLISRFGKFRVLDKKERRGRNPGTGNDQMLPARRVLAFRCSGNLRKKINGS